MYRQAPKPIVCVHGELCANGFKKDHRAIVYVGRMLEWAPGFGSVFDVDTYPLSTTPKLYIYLEIFLYTFYTVCIIVYTRIVNNNVCTYLYYYVINVIKNTCSMYR